MPAKPCPTCRSERCGNHAACARKATAEVERIAANRLKCQQELAARREYALGALATLQGIADLEPLYRDAIPNIREEWLRKGHGWTENDEIATRIEIARQFYERKRALQLQQRMAALIFGMPPDELWNRIVSGHKPGKAQ